MPEETITITLAEYQKLLKDQEWLGCLNEAGVDNWQGIEVAYEIQEEIEAKAKDE